MKKTFGLLVVLLVFSSCSFHQLEYKGGERIAFGGLNKKQVSFTAGATILNPNGFAIKVKPSELKLIIEGEYMGVVYLEKEVRVNRKSEEYVEGTFVATLADGALFRTLKFVNKEELEVCIKGTVKAKVWMFGKELNVNEKRTIRSSDLKYW
ncbi:MAG: LEA type 2 family protein [Crocinitomicaceae bacterium]|nr:LEA type 2 family protein [Crocinitomicaceae bacterium]MDG1775789.1 LEA type 2 family protein [Crocinitomicaceae bacterium]